MAKPQINLPPSEIWGDLGLGRGSRLYNFHAYNYLQRELPTTSTFTERLAQPRAGFPGVRWQYAPRVLHFSAFHYFCAEFFVIEVCMCVCIECFTPWAVAL